MLSHGCRSRHRIRRTPMFKEIERHDNCTVIICEDDQTGEIDISWFENEHPPKLMITSLEEEE